MFGVVVVVVGGGFCYHDRDKVRTFLEEILDFFLGWFCHIRRGFQSLLPPYVKSANTKKQR